MPSVVVVDQGGIPVVNTPLGAPMTVASNGFGVAVTIAANGFGTPVYLLNENGTPWTAYDPDASTLFARFTTPPTDARKTLISNLIIALKAADVWSKLDAFYVMAAHDAQAARQNWIRDAFNLTAVSSPSFTVDRGYATNGTTSYLNTGYTPATDGVNFTQNAASLGIWSREDSVNTGNDIGGREGATSRQTAIILRPTTTTLHARINLGNANGSIASNSSLGFFVASRDDASTIRTYRDGSLLGTGSYASTDPSPQPLFIGASNTNGTATAFQAREYAASMAGASLDAAQNANLYAALNTYMQAVGAA
jgi:hypothetical protein